MWSSSENEPGLKGLETDTLLIASLLSVSDVRRHARCGAAWGTPSPKWAKPRSLVPSPGHTILFPTSHKCGTYLFKMYLM